MSDPNRCFDLVDVLAAFTAASKSVNQDIDLVTFNVHVLCQFGHDIDAGKRGMSSLFGIKWKNAQKPVYAALSLQITKAVLTAYSNCDRLDARFVSLLDINDPAREVVALDPTLIHPQKHICPVTRFGASGPGVDRQKGIVFVEFTG